jgi:hypothetical protein
MLRTVESSFAHLLCFTLQDSVSNLPVDSNILQKVSKCTKSNPCLVIVNGAFLTGLPDGWELDTDDAGRVYFIELVHSLVLLVLLIRI